MSTNPVVLDKSKCCMCGRVLNDPADRMSMDCGNDCWGCIGLIEAEMGDAESLTQVVWEFAFGLRNDYPVSESFIREINGYLANQ